MHGDGAHRVDLRRSWVRPGSGRRGRERAAKAVQVQSPWPTAELERISFAGHIATLRRGRSPVQGVATDLVLVSLLVRHAGGVAPIRDYWGDRQHSPAYSTPAKMKPASRHAAVQRLTVMSLEGTVVTWCGSARPLAGSLMLFGVSWEIHLWQERGLAANTLACREAGDLRIASHRLESVHTRIRRRALDIRVVEDGQPVWPSAWLVLVAPAGGAAVGQRSFG